MAQFNFLILITKVPFFTFFAQFAAAGQVGPAHDGSQIKGNASLAQDVCVRALELSELLEALNARQRSLVAFAEGFKNFLIRSGINGVV
jgi:hypothetical protein